MQTPRAETEMHCVRHQIDCEFCRVPETKDIPKLGSQQGGPFGVMYDPMRSTNSNFYRELAVHEFLTRICREVRITVKNIGEVPATNVRVEIVIPVGIGILPKLKLPYRPQRTHSLESRVMMSQFRTPLRRDRGEVTIDENPDRSRIEIDCKDLQPGRRVWSDEFYVGAGKTAEYAISGEVFADNLPVPQPFTLTVAAKVEHTTLTLEDLRKLPD